MRRTGFVLLLALQLTACGKATVGISHTLTATNPTHKPTLDCRTADSEIYAKLAGKLNFKSSTVTMLANGTCAVMVEITPANTTLTLLQTLRNSKSYTYYMMGTGRLVNVWIDDAPDVFKDSSGKVLDSSPSDQDCNTARDALKGVFEEATITTVIDPNSRGGPRRCYLDAQFKGDTFYESFINWNNPQGHHEPFHYYVKSGNLTKVVYIHAISTPE